MFWVRQKCAAKTNLTYLKIYQSSRKLKCKLNLSLCLNFDDALIISRVEL